jgi:hypothetical protein
MTIEQYFYRHIRGGVVYVHSFSTLELDGGERSTSGPGGFIPEEKSRQPLNKRPSRPQSRFGPCGEEINILSLPGFEPGPCSPQPSRHTDCAIPAPGIKRQPTKY